MTDATSDARFTLIIVDDEPLARDGLRDAVSRAGVTGVEVAATCENGVVALERIRELQPDILLLDIAMPVLDGFAMLERLEPETTPPAVIFVTAYDEHAVRAFAAEALDFLVKPVADARLAAGLERAVRRVSEARALRAALAAGRDGGAKGNAGVGENEGATENARAAEPGVSPYLQQLIIPDRGRQHVVPVSEIEWIEGDTYYVRVHSGGRVRLLRERMSVLEASLDPATFIRTHRSALVRLDLIRELRPESPYSYSAMLVSGARVPVSRERYKALEARLSRR